MWSTKSSKCCIRVRRSCGTPAPRTRGTLAFRLRNDRGELVPVHLKGSVVLNLRVSVFSVRALHEKGVKLDLMANPAVLCHGNSAFPVLTEYPQKVILRTLLNEQDNTRDNTLSHAAVDTDSCHRTMDPCRPRALKELPQSLQQVRMILLTVDRSRKAG